jgi:hypothetical protein
MFPSGGSSLRARRRANGAASVPPMRIGRLHEEFKRRITA